MRTVILLSSIGALACGTAAAIIAIRVLVGVLS
jgi:hypothetical protein